MLKVESIQKPVHRVASIRVHISGVTDETDADLSAAALAAAHETTGSTFGSTVTRYDNGFASVALHRD